MAPRRTGGFALSLLLALPGSGQAPAPFRAPLSPRFKHWMASHRPRGTPGPLGGGKEGGPRTRGWVPSPVDLSHVRGPVLHHGAGTPPFPPVYDLRSQGLVTPVRDQGPYGTCWTFACMASLEGSLLRKGLGAADLSEWNLAYYAYRPFNTSLMTSFTPGSPSFGMDPIFDQGGSDWMSAAILGRGTGAVDERENPYPAGAYRPEPRPKGDLPDGTEELRVPLEGAFYLFNEFQTLSAEDVKTALTRFGPVVVALDWEDNAYDETAATFRDTLAQPWSINHEVAIIGWDDGFPASRFPRDNRPARDGAWIVRNSWGPAWGEEGTFHLSYDSKAYDGTVFVGGTRTTRRIRQYDPLGWCACLGYGSSTATCANVFRAEAPETVTAVAFYTPAIGTSYELSFRAGVLGDPGTGSPLGPAETGLLQAPGFHVVHLAEPVRVPAGAYAAVLKLTTPGTPFPVAVQEPIPGYSENSRAHHARSYMSPDGAAWRDLGASCDGAIVCLKVFVE
jgi:C1A family cysteine protease